MSRAQTRSCASGPGQHAGPRTTPLGQRVVTTTTAVRCTLCWLTTHSVATLTTRTPNMFPLSHYSSAPLGYPLTLPQYTFPSSIPSLPSSIPSIPSIPSFPSSIPSSMPPIRTAARSTAPKPYDRHCPHPNCKRVFNKAGNLNRHVDDCHPDLRPSGSATCMRCMDVFPSVNALRLHDLNCGDAMSSSSSVTPPPTDEEMATTSPSSTSSSSASPSSASRSFVPVQLTALPGTDEGFLQWLTEGHAGEGLNIERAKPAAIQDMRRHLKHFRTSLLCRLFPEERNFTLQFLIQKHVAQAAIDDLRARGVGAERQSQLFGVLRKICFYIVSEQTRITRTTVTVRTLPGWAAIDGAAFTSNRQRKLHQKDVVAFDPNKAKRLTTEEIRQVMTECLRRLKVMQFEDEVLDRKRFTKTLIVATLCFLLGPRQNLLQHLRCDKMLLRPRTEGNDTDEYIFKQSALTAKTENAVYLVVPAPLTSAMDCYLNEILPPNYTGPLFTQRDGSARHNYTDIFKELTGHITQRPVCAHTVRHTIATWAKEDESVTEAERAALPRVQDHSQATHDLYYARTNHERDVRAIQSKLLRGVVDVMDEVEQVVQVV